MPDPIGIAMPLMGVSVTAGIVVAWPKAVGGAVEGVGCRVSGVGALPQRRFEPAAAAAAVLSRPGRRAVICSPVARRIAEQHGIDLNSVEGSGMRGRVRKADVLALLDAAPTPD